jgi:NAD(P)-dependent dehydrogenase (short-subunit alcohol dehydrogenase family)
MGVSGSKPHEIESKWFADFERNKVPSMEGKTVAITGCTPGTGYIVARTCVKKGAKNVLLLNRPSDRATKAENDLMAFIDGCKTNIETIPCDLQDFNSVRAAAKKIKKKYKAIDVLCNNAGIMAREDKATEDGYDVQMKTNHLSHFLLTKELYPLLKRANELRGEARVVQHSSVARSGSLVSGGAPLKAEYFGKNGGNLGGNGASMFFGGARWVRYQQTKLANAVFTKALAERFGDSGIKAAVAAPGLATTNLSISTNEDGGMGSGMWFMHFSQSAEDGSMPILAACFDPTMQNGDFWEPANRSNTVGPAVKVKWDKLSNDPESAKLLWKVSEEACGPFVI